MSGAHWRPLSPADLPAVTAIAEAVHPGYPERPAIFAERLSLFPEGCFLAEADGAPAGYALAHPWMEGAPPALDTLLGRLPDRPDCLYLHDVALLPAARGSGLGRALIVRLEALARHLALPRISLVAVNNSQAFWATLGFRNADHPGLAPKLASYGRDARYMTRQIARV